MLVVEDVHRTIEFDACLVGAARRSLLDVQHRHLWIIPHFPAGVGDPFGPIQVLSIHEEGLIEQSGLQDGLTPDQHERTDDRIDARDLVRVEVRQVVAAEPGALWEKPVQVQHVPERVNGRREGTPARLVERTVQPHQLRPCHAGALPAIHERDHGRQRMGRQHGVRIQQQRERRQRSAGVLWQPVAKVVRQLVSEPIQSQTLVVGRRISNIVVVRDHLHLRELAAHHGDAVVGRRVVYNTRCKCQTSRRGPAFPGRQLRHVELAGVDRLQTIAQEGAGVIVDNNDHEIGAAGGRFVHCGGIIHVAPLRVNCSQRGFMLECLHNNARIVWTVWCASES